MDNWFDDNFTKAFEPGNDRELNAQRSIEEDWRRVGIRDTKVRDDIAKTADSTRDTVDELKALREQVALLTKDLEIERDAREKSDSINLGLSISALAIAVLSLLASIAMPILQMLME